MVEGLRAAAASLAIMGEIRPLLAEILSTMEAGGTVTEAAAASPTPGAARVGVSGGAGAATAEDMAPMRPAAPTGREALPRPGSMGK